MNTRPMASSWRTGVQICLVVLACLPETVFGQIGRKLVDIPVLYGGRARRRAVSDSRASEFDQYWPVIKLRQVNGNRYEGRADLKLEPDTQSPLGSRIVKRVDLPGKYSCNVSPVRSVRSGDTVTVSVTLVALDLDSVGDQWKGVEVATVLIDGGPWETEVPVVMDGQPVEGNGVVTIRQTGLGEYEGCAEIRTGLEAALPLSCKITSLGLFSGKYSCAITTPENLVPGQTVTVCATLKDPGCRGHRPEAEDMKVALLSVEGGAWKTEIPVVVDNADWTNLVTGNGSLVFVPNREALQLHLHQTGLRDFTACLDIDVQTRAGMRLASSISATGALAAKYGCRLVETYLEAPRGTATVCTDMREVKYRRWDWRPDGARTAPHAASGPLKGTRVATVSVYGMPAESDVIVEFAPSGLDLQAYDGSITCHVELPTGYAPSEVDVRRLLLNGSWQAQVGSEVIGDYDADGKPDLTVTFARRGLVEHLLSETSGAPEEAELVITGQLADGTPFRGARLVAVIGHSGGD